ncbi:cation-translocating P-type ATPase [Comamonas sp. Y6]|uniref:Cation-translocating P-type ATPase n=1 Tax=Comamonas resistens TaxID=3046670 RepID=A0ABY8SWH1_9BURK|nr:cation-translocating P-type ATPase [Comamonas resistens]MDL5037912.1 cation-translocating P-type ATPase [Comamonas resistens]WHS67394.1 cation-translocating P-type ATPase [Comamonas resistens]
MFQTTPVQPRPDEQAAIDTGSPVQPQASSHLLDDPHEWSSFGRPAAQNPQAPIPEDPTESPVWDSFVVLEGMHCAACALTIEEALKAVPGVEGAEVSAATRRARVVWRHAQVLPSQWMEAVARAGYHAMPARDAFAREIRLAETRRALWRWLVAGFCMMQVMMYAWPAYNAKPGDLSLEMETLLRWASWVISLPVVLFCCGPFFKSALKDIGQRRVSMDLPVAIGMLITFVISTLGTFDPSGPFGHEVFFDSLTMFVFFLLTGRWLELRLRDRTAGALEAVMNRLPDSVLRLKPDGDEFERVATRRLRTGDVVRVLTGEAFPADGTIVRGSTHADEALLTGESTPVLRAEGEMVTAGSYNLDSVVDVRVDSVGEGTRFAQIVGLMESASLQKPRLAQLADKVARPFLVVVLLAALAAAIWWWPVDHGKAMMVAVAVLIVTCPCALSLATPVAMLTAAGTLARGGVLVRNLQGLEALASVDTLVFDKTGTLTRDGLVLRALTPAEGQSADEVLALAALLARQSMHPASRSLVKAAQAAQLPATSWQLDSVQEVAGSGLDVWVESADKAQRRHLRLGSARHCSVAELASEQAGRSVMLAEEVRGDWVPLVQFHLSEDVRPEAAQVIADLKKHGVSVQLLSGDRSAAVQTVAAKLGIEQARGDCQPQDKLAAMQAAQAQGHQVAMVGDGLNDGPVLAGAHVSFAFGRAVPLAQSRADFVVLGDSLELVLQSLLLARRTLSVVRQNLGWAAAYNAISIPLALMGWMPAWLAGLGMALSSLLVVANAARLARALPLQGTDSNASDPAPLAPRGTVMPLTQGGH